MKRYRIGLLVTALLLVVSSAWSFSFFGLFDSDDDQSALIDSIPADTAWVALGKNITPGAQLMDDWAKQSTMTDLPDMPDIFSSTAGMQVLAWLFEDYSNVLQLGYQGKTGYSALLARYGLDEAGSYAFYLDGAIPVFRFQVSDTDAIEQLIADITEGTGQVPENRTLDDMTINHWPLSAATAQQRFDLAMAVDSNFATLTLLTETDDNTRLSQRFGKLAQEVSLASSDDWKSLDSDYDFNDYSRGYFSIARIAEAILMPQNNGMGRDLQRLAPGPMAELNAKMGNDCPAEWLGIAQQMPRLVYGSEELDSSAQHFYQSIRLVLEMNNAAVTEQLTQLSGSVPAYSRDTGDKLLALALGLNVDALTPVAVSLLTQLRSANLDCPALVKLQQQAAQWNPAVLGILSGLAQGLKGAGLAIYDLQADADSPFGLSGSALVSLSADNPSLLASSLLASVPPLAGLQIPTNGESVTLPEMGLPQPIQLAIKGKHLVLYTGTAAAEAADRLAREPLNNDGNFAFTANYQATGKSLLALAESPLSGALQRLEDAGGCTSFYIGMLQSSQTPLQISYLDQYTERGWEATLGADFEAEAIDLNIQPGDYQTDTLSSDCHWFPDATETLNADGSGHYHQQDANNRCEVYQIDYQWHQQGNRLVQQSSAERRRDSCDQQWQSLDASDYECTVLATFDSGFYCLYNFDGEATLMRYRR